MGFGCDSPQTSPQSVARQLIEILHRAHDMWEAGQIRGVEIARIYAPLTPTGAITSSAWMTAFLRARYGYLVAPLGP